MTHIPTSDSSITSELSVTAHWARPVVADTGDRTALMLRITTGPAPATARQRAPRYKYPQEDIAIG